MSPSGPYLWHVWPSRYFPATVEEETTFVSDALTAAEMVGLSSPVDLRRGDITATLNALRCGLSWSEFRRAAPGLRPGSVLSAYWYVDRLRDKALSSFYRFAADPVGGLVRYGMDATRVAPVLTQQLVSIGRDPDPESRAAALTAMWQRIREVRELAVEVEDAMAAAAADGDLTRAVSLGRDLYDPYQGSLWTDPFYLPDRVGVLDPVRVTDLLAGRPPAPDIVKR